MDQELLDLIEREIEEGYISERHHDTEPYRILNYTPKAQYEGRWNEATMQCRGLILDYDNNVIARPFRKFFNYEEFPEQVPLNECFDVYEKMDGSLGISYYTQDGLVQIATRGSFNSDQALYATRLLHTKYEKSAICMDPGFTYLFEIIYPENQIVVDYGDKEELVLLAVFDRKTGEEQDLDGFYYLDFPVVEKYAITDIEEVMSSEIQEDNREGFVLVFESGFRLKVKFEEYKRIHRIVCGLNEKRIWEIFCSGESIGQYAGMIPDELYEWAKGVHRDLQRQYMKIYRDAVDAFVARPVTDDRKELAEYFRTQEHPSLLFSFLDGKRFEEYICKQIKPKVTKKFEII